MPKLKIEPELLIMLELLMSASELLLIMPELSMVPKIVGPGCGSWSEWI